MPEATFPHASSVTFPLLRESCQSSFFSSRSAHTTDARGDLVSMITHDLRAPLAKHSIFLDLIRSGFYKQSDPLFDDRLVDVLSALKNGRFLAQFP